MARIMVIGIPSMAVLNGHAVAGGLFLGLCHDQVIMNTVNPKCQLWVNEL